MDFQRYIFAEMTQFITLDRCGVPNHPIEAAQDWRSVLFDNIAPFGCTGVINNSTPSHSTVFGVPVTHHNNLSVTAAAAGGILGFILEVVRSGSGVAHVEVVGMSSGIFKYP